MSATNIENVKEQDQEVEEDQAIAVDAGSSMQEQYDSEKNDENPLTSPEQEVTCCEFSTLITLLYVSIENLYGGNPFESSHACKYKLDEICPLEFCRKKLSRISTEEFYQRNVR